MQAAVIGLVVLIATAASTLALGLLVDSNAPFDYAFAAQRGSEVTAATKASPAQLAATTRPAGVTVAAGPFPETTVTASFPVTPPSGSGPKGGALLGTDSWLGGRADHALEPDRELLSGRGAGRPGSRS